LGRVAVFLWVALVGCNAGVSVNAGEQAGTSAANVAEMNRRLQSLPDLQQVVVEYEALSWRIAAAVEDVAPEMVWEEVHNSGKRACPGDLAESDGFVIVTTKLVSAVPIPPDKWTPASEVVRVIAAEVGLTTQTIRQI
jgi:hypothetical protein